MIHAILITVNPEIFARILFSKMALKDTFATFKISRLGYDLIPISVNDRMISPFREVLFYAMFHKNKTHTKI